MPSLPPPTLKSKAGTVGRRAPPQPIPRRNWRSVSATMRAIRSDRLSFGIAGTSTRRVGTVSRRRQRAGSGQPSGDLDGHVAAALGDAAGHFPGFQ